jgi:hypothetical protein
MLPHCFSIMITLVRLNQVSRVRMSQKAENVIYNAIIESFLRIHSFWGHNHRFLRTLKTAQPRNFSSLIDVQNIITPRPFIVSGYVNNCLKSEKLVYIFHVELQVIFLLQGHENLIFVKAVQSNQIRCQSQNFCFDVSWRIQGCPPPWCFTNVMGCPSYLHEGSFHEMVSIRLHGSAIFCFSLTTVRCACLQYLSSILIYMREPLINVSIKSPLGLISCPQKPK